MSHIIPILIAVKNSLHKLSVFPIHERTAFVENVGAAIAYFVLISLKTLFNLSMRKSYLCDSEIAVYMLGGQIAIAISHGIVTMTLSRHQSS